MAPENDLIQEVKRLNKVLTKVYGQQSLFQTFLRGILSGLGSVLGASIVLAFVVYLLRNVNVIPIIGTWLSQITMNVLDKLPQR